QPADECLYNQPVIVGKLVDDSIAVEVHRRICGVGETTIRYEVATPIEPPRQINYYSRLELVRNIETVPAIINIDVEWILRTEECIGIPFTGVITVVARPRVVGEPLKMVAKTLIHAANDCIVIPAAEAG